MQFNAVLQVESVKQAAISFAQLLTMHCNSGRPASVRFVELEMASMGRTASFTRTRKMNNRSSEEWRW